MNKLFDQWYKEPWLWFCFILLGITIVGGLILVMLAFQHAPAELNSQWYRHGILVNQHRVQDDFIKTLHLASELTIDPASDNITVKIVSSAKPSDANAVKLAYPSQLQFYIEHPIFPNLDQTITLTHANGNTYVGKATGKLSGRRYLLITNAAGPWQLAGEAYLPNDGVLYLR